MYIYQKLKSYIEGKNNPQVGHGQVDARQTYITNDINKICKLYLIRC